LERIDPDVNALYFGSRKIIEAQELNHQAIFHHPTSGVD
jgi:hypothetical protein